MDFSSRQRPAGLLRVGSGGIRVTPKPRGGDWLRWDLENLKSDGFDLIVSLLTPEEDAELCLEEEASLCAELDIEFYRFPFPTVACLRTEPVSKGSQRRSTVCCPRDIAESSTVGPDLAEHPYWHAGS